MNNKNKMLLSLILVSLGLFLLGNKSVIYADCCVDAACSSTVPCGCGDTNFACGPGECCLNNEACTTECSAGIGANCYPRPNWNCPAGQLPNFGALQNSDFSKCRKECLFANDNLANPCCTGTACLVVELGCKEKNCELVCDNGCYWDCETVCQYNHAQAPCVPACTVPSISGVTQTSPLGTLNFSISGSGSGGSSYKLYIDQVESDVIGSCAGGLEGAGSGPCDKIVDIPTGTTSLSVSLTLGTVYYYKTVAISNSSVCAASPIGKTISSCYLPDLSLVYGGQDRRLDAGIEQADSLDGVNEIERVDFAENPAINVVSVVGGPSDTLYPYGKDIHPESSGSTTIRGRVYFVGNSGSEDFACQYNSSIIVTTPNPWWQVIDSDVVSSIAIGSNVPSASGYFGLPGAGGYPGVPSAPSLDFGNGSASENYNWQAETGITGPRTFNYDYFDGIRPSDITLNDAALGIESGGTASGDYYWFKHVGPLALPPTNISSRKVVLYVDGDLNITGDISLTDAFLMIIVGGTITINPDVTSLEGLFVSDGAVSTGTLGPGTDPAPLYVRGSLASYGGINLDRDLVDNGDPAHQFEYAPDLILMFPPELSYRRINWKEVAP